MTCPSEAPRLIFVGGLHRSGTTIVARTLETHPSVAGFRGTGVPEHEGQLLQDVYPLAWVHGGPGVFAFHPAAHLTEETPGAGRQAGRRLLAAWGPYWDHSRPVVVEKSPPNLIRTRFLQAAFPDACFVLVMRHPVIVALRT